MGFLINLLTGGVVDKIGGLFKQFFGNKEKRDDQKAEENVKVLDQFAAEFHDRTGRTWFDSLVDGLNRLPRPLGFFTTMWMFVWPVYDAEGFSVAMNSYTLMPAWLTQLIFGVWALYFGGRIITKDFAMGGPSTKAIATYLATQKAIKSTFASEKPLEPQGQGVSVSATRVPDAYESVPGRQSEGEFSGAMADPTPMSLPSIVEWNRRNQEGKT